MYIFTANGAYSKYLIGADGGRSFVRRVSGIPFDGDTSEDKWIRIDGIVETDMPITRAYGYVKRTCVCSFGVSGLDLLPVPSKARRMVMFFGYLLTTELPVLDTLIVQTLPQSIQTELLKKSLSRRPLNV